eukprot:5541195-Amphidinium_carterae.1
MGHRWHCRVHPDWLSSSTKVVARTVDLRSAYKQLPVSVRDLPLAVCSFNACSRGLEVVLCMIGGLLSTSYFEDFPFVEPSLTAPSATKLAESMLDLLGWEFDS